jgi:hypothetical protein
LSSPGRRRASAFYKTRIGGSGATFVRRAFKTKVILSFLIYGKAKASFGNFPATGSWRMALRVYLPRSAGTLNCVANSEDMSIRMTDVHLASIPWHIRWRPCDLYALLHTALVYDVNIVNPDRHPYRSFSGFVRFWTERLRERASPSSALSPLAKEDLALT